jgi:hypothetical protein
MRVIAIAFSAFFASSCVVVVSSSCTDGLLNGDESDIDCGGSCGSTCGTNEHCFANHDCASGVCDPSGRCAPGGPPPASCTDGVRNGTESDVDCGGSCGATCAANKACNTSADCQSGLCTGSFCTGHPTGAGTTPTTAPETDSIQPSVGSAAPAAGGYAIAAAPGSFRVTMISSPSTPNEFVGSIFTKGGITAVSAGCGGACSITSADFISQPIAVSGGQRIDFDIIAPNNMPAGFDLSVTTNSATYPLYLDLLQDGQRVTQSIVFPAGGGGGGTLRNPGSVPFGLVAQ